MKEEFNELQTPPKSYIEGLVESTDEKLREAFLSDTMAYNNSMAFASVHHGEPCPDDQLAGRKDTCKYNGKYFLFYTKLFFNYNAIFLYQISKL